MSVSNGVGVGVGVNSPYNMEGGGASGTVFIFDCVCVSFWF